MNEGLKHIAQLLKSMSETFVIEPAELSNEGDEVIADGLKISDIKNDGSNFLAVMFETFNELVQRMSPEHEVIYDTDYGLVIARKKVVTEYIIENFE